ncbi:MAG: hypothetical protein GXO76_06615 [Calditrichaeota bacterium]|nr:hypothetical protein [Calditrichota bacterium]
MKGAVRNRTQSMWPGIVLIVIGLILLLNQLDIFTFDWNVFWPSLVILLGIFFFVRVPRDRGAIFPGVLFFLSGLLFLVKNLSWYEPYIEVSIGGMLMIILGLAFVALYIVQPENWGLLIPASLFLFFGFIIWADRVGLIDWYTRRQILRLWPALLILIGTGIVISGLQASKKSEEPPDTPPSGSEDMTEIKKTPSPE